MFSLDIKIGFDSKRQAMDFFKSIKPELDEEFGRSRTTVALKDKLLVVNVSASDKTALRASLNSLMKPLILFNDLEELG